MRRSRQVTTKVWHNPEIESFARRSSPSRAKAQSEGSATRQHHAALEALFAPRTKADETPPSPAAKAPRIVLAQPTPVDPIAAERQRLLNRLLAAEGRPAITKAVKDYLAAGHELPREQDVCLQLLEHPDEDRVRGAIDTLSSLLETEPAKRRAVLDSRLRRLAEFADEKPTRDAAEALRRQLR